MCTVSFYKDKEKTVLTSNRDEHVSRPLALFPALYAINDTQLYFPKDPLAGGSWFVVNKEGYVFVLLNGADKKHIPEYPYRKSRGLILLEVSSASNFKDAWTYLDLTRIEPFTLLVYYNVILYQCRWNGREKSMTEVDTQIPRIWSSATLYTKESIAKREKWFSQFLNEKSNNMSENDLIDFHTGTQMHDTENGLIINRNEILLTKNVTQVVIGKDKSISMIHIDLIKQVKTKLHIYS